MLLVDYFQSIHDITWDFAKQCGVKYGAIRLPENKNFDITEKSHWRSCIQKFTEFGIKPIVIEPIPDSLHHHIKIGDAQRDECIEKVIKMMEFMHEFQIKTICFNWMAYIGWTRTSKTVSGRGGALTTEFDISEFKGGMEKITKEQLWENYEYFIKAVIYYAEKYEINLALHPDDPPVEKLGDVERIMINRENIKKAINILKSQRLGITMCQATYYVMEENLYEVIPEMAEKIFFIHFRNVTGCKYKFLETFHDDGSIPMVEIMKLYKDYGIHVPVRVDHVPLMAGEKQGSAGYSALGRLYAIGYLRGILESLGMKEDIEDV